MLRLGKLSLSVFDRALLAACRFLARKMGAKTLANVLANGPFARRTGLCASLPPHVTVGRHSYGAKWETFLLPSAKAPVCIGNFCSIASGVRIICHADHAVDLPSTYPFRTLMTRRLARVPAGMGPNQDAITKGPITIGHDVWIGEGAIILSGSTIGTGAVVGAGAVVAGDVPPYAIMVGNPARQIRTRHAEFVDALLKSRWWDLPDAEIAAMDQVFYDRNVLAFLDAVSAAWRRQAAEEADA
mgnify:CR=1 FL=1